MLTREVHEAMGKKILLADDSITIQKVIELTFSDEDFDVVTVGNGRLAIERLEDIQPRHRAVRHHHAGEGRLRSLRVRQEASQAFGTPVLLLTGAFEPFDQERAARAGCDGFLAKPFEPASLIGKVKELLARLDPPGDRAACVRSEPAAPAPAEMPPAPEPAFAAPEPDSSEPLVEEEPASEPTVSFIPDEPMFTEEPLIEDLGRAEFSRPRIRSFPRPCRPMNRPSWSRSSTGSGEELESAPDD